MADNKYDKEFRKRYVALDKEIKRREKKIQVIVDNFMKYPERSNTYWNGVKAELNAEYTAMGKAFSDWAEYQLPQMYDRSVLEGMKYSRKLKSIPNKPKLTAQELLKTDYSVRVSAALYQSAIDDFYTALVNGRKGMNRLIRSTQQTLIAEHQVDAAVAKAYSSGNLRIATVMKKAGTLANSLLVNGEVKPVSILCKDGRVRRYSVQYYSELVARSKWHAAQAEGVKSVAANYQTDLVRVSSHNTDTVICQQYEAKVFSISGKSKDFPLLDMSPPFHPNCLHYIMVTFPETLKLSGQYVAMSEFSKDRTDRPPNLETFIPVKDREAAA